MKVFIGVPTPEYQHMIFTSSLVGLITYSTQQGIDVVYKPQVGNRTDRNRNLILKDALTTDWDYMLWLDADMNYPSDIIEKYLKAIEETKADIMGCLYFKRKPPFAPIGYIGKGTQKGKYQGINPHDIGNSVQEVYALGYGGMMVSRRVYEALGDDKWTKYGENFHKPDFIDHGYQTHDILFCETARDHGFKTYMHGGVRPTHLSTIEVGYEDWIKEMGKPEPVKSVTVIMPSIHPELANKTAKILSSRAGYPHKMLVMEDTDKIGYVGLCNIAIKDYPSDYYVYLTDDIFPSRNWLASAMQLIEEKKCGLLGFNDGKWEGAIATCGLIEHNWMLKNYKGNMFFPEYFGHYNDTELTVFAMNDKTYCYNPNISLIEVDYEKDQKKVHPKDKELFYQRKKTMFDGRISDEKLVNLFS